MKSSSDDPNMGQWNYEADPKQKQLNVDTGRSI